MGISHFVTLPFFESKTARQKEKKCLRVRFPDLFYNEREFDDESKKYCKCGFQSTINRLNFKKFKLFNIKF